MTKIESSQVIYVKYGDTPGEIEDDVVIIGKDDHEIEVGQMTLHRQSTNLAVFWQAKILTNWSGP